MANRILDAINRRGSPEPPVLPWIMHQTWNHVLFATWEVPAAMLRPLVPSGMELDTFQGKTYVSQIPFHMEKVHLRALPALPGTTNFPQLNCRTYVRVNGEPGICFFSIDADAWLADWVARNVYRLPYLSSSMIFESRSDGSYRLESHRARADLQNAAEFVATWKPNGAPHAIDPGTLEDFVANRDLMFVQLQSGLILRGAIRHAPWQVQDVEASIEKNTILQAAGIDITAPPASLAYSAGTDVLCWPMLPAKL